MTNQNDDNDSCDSCDEYPTEAALEVIAKWCPYNQHGSDQMTFGDAIEALKAGKRVAREGWNGKGMWLCLMPGFTVPACMVNERTRKFVPPGVDLPCGAYIVMWTAQGVWQPGWLASQADMFSDDWSVVE